MYCYYIRDILIALMDMKRGALVMAFMTATLGPSMEHISIEVLKVKSLTQTHPCPRRWKMYPDPVGRGRTRPYRPWSVSAYT